MKSRRRKKVKSNCNKHSEFNYLPPEVWTQILLSLPAKTLLRFRCVCKSWCSIIDNPHFVNMHFKLCKFNSGNNKKKLLVALQELGKLGYEGCLLTVRNAENLRYTGRIFRISDSYSYHIIGSCNGLLLVERYYTSHFPCDFEFRLWNPCIRKSLIIPTCPLVNCRYLLGFAPDSQDYKVVGFAFDLTQGEGYGKMYIAAYTPSNPQWIVKNDPLNNVSLLSCSHPRGLFHSLSAALFFQGAAYCLVRNDKKYSRVLTHVASFDLDKENITFLELPFSLEETGSLRLLFLFLLGGSLALFSISEVTSSIWVLDQDNKKGPWTLWFSGQSSQDGYELFNAGSIKNVFYCERDGGYFVYEKKTYNLASGQVQELKKSMRFYFELKAYSESLVLSKACGARDLRTSP